MNRILEEEYLNISKDLESHHEIFYTMWSLSRPTFTKETDTAHITFDTTGKAIEVQVNEELWNSLDYTNKKFLLCHEYLHSILRHGQRSIGVKSHEAFNIAADIVINELLITNFGFQYDSIKNAKEFCFLRTVFPNRTDILPNQHFEYYYQKLLENAIPINVRLVDDHSKMEIMPDEIAKEIGSSLSPEGIKSILDILGSQNDKEKSTRAGTEAGNLTEYLGIDLKTIKKKKKWETIIHQWAVKNIKIRDRDMEQWARVSRRTTLMCKDFFIPSDMEIEELESEKEKLEVLFFLDTSGSCTGLGKRFFRAALSLPEDKFITHLYCFDTKVYKVDKVKQKLYGFGGTSFSCIDEEVNRYAAENKSYPDAIFIITDGQGSEVKPLKPEVWYWFLTESPEVLRGLVPSKCNVFHLKDFE